MSPKQQQFTVKRKRQYQEGSRGQGEKIFRKEKHKEAKGKDYENKWEGGSVAFLQH